MAGFNYRAQNRNGSLEACSSRLECLNSGLLYNNKTAVSSAMLYGRVTEVG